MEKKGRQTPIFSGINVQGKSSQSQTILRVKNYSLLGRTGNWKPKHSILAKVPKNHQAQWGELMIEDGFVATGPGHLAVLVNHELLCMLKCPRVKPDNQSLVKTE